MCHNVHHPKTHSVVLFTSRGGVFTLRNGDGRRHVEEYSPPFAGSFSPLNLSLAPILAPEANTDQL